MNRRVHAMSGPGLPTEAALFRQAQVGCRDSLNRLMATHENLVHAVVRRQALGQLPFAEALQAGRIGLWHAILGYDPQRGRAFSTYAWIAIMHHIWQAVKVAERAASRLECQVPLGRAVSSPSDIADPALAWEAQTVSSAVRETVNRLPEELRLVVVARYDLGGAGQALYSRIGVLLGLSAERARQLHTEALLWLRQPANSQSLRSLLGRHTVADYEAVEAETQRWLKCRGKRHGRQL